MGAGRWRPRLAETLELVASAAPAFQDDWWIIGSAAAALCGANIANVADVDLLVSEGDAARLLALWADVAAAPADPSDRFRSAIFARFDHAPLPIEVFGGFEVRVGDDFRPVRLLSREARGGVFTPSVAEQIALLKTMGRAKDLARIGAFAG